MEENTNQEEQKPVEVAQPVLPEPTPEVSHTMKKKKHHPVVIVERDWKEYLGECLLIVFSVALAIGITEYLTSLHEEKQASEILYQLKEELINNKKNAKEQYDYHLQVLKNIDSALHHPEFAKKFINDSGEIDLTHTIAPEGVLRHDLSDVAWQVAKQNNIYAIEVFHL